MIQIFYIISFKSHLFSFYYDSENIVQEQISFKSQKKTPPKIIFSGAKKNFSANIFNNQVNLFTQNKSDDIFLCTYKNNFWQQKKILQHKFNYELKIYPFISQNKLQHDFFLLYNIPATEKNSFYFALNQLKNNRWEFLKRVDKFYDIKNFFVQKLNSQHALIFYKTKLNSGEITFGYREINLNQQTDFYNIYSGFQDIPYANFLTTHNSIHSLFVVQNIFTRQLIYKRKQNKFFSKPVNLFRNPNINNPLLLIIKNNLYALWTIQNKIYFCVSDNNGFTFTNPQIYSSNNQEITKAIYLSDKNLDPQNFYCREIYVNKNSPCEIKFLPDLINNFHQEQNYCQQQKFETDQMQINKLKNQINIKNKQLEIKNKKIMDLTTVLKNKNQEIISLLNKNKADSSS